VEPQDSTGFQEDLLASLPRLRRFALALTGHPLQADELVQITCERAIAKAAEWDQEQPLLPWLYTMARNLLAVEHRKAARRGAVPANKVVALLSHMGGEEAARAAQLIAPVLGLPDAMASVFLLVSVEGHSYAEAAEILGIPQSTVMSRMAAARAKLRAQWEGLE